MLPKVGFEISLANCIYLWKSNIMIQEFDSPISANDGSLGTNSYMAEATKAVEMANAQLGLKLDVNHPDRVNKNSNLNGYLGGYFFWDVVENNVKIGEIAAFHARNHNYIHVFFYPFA